MFAEFGVLNFWTYVIGALFIVLVPGPNTFFILKTSVENGVKKGCFAAIGVFIGDAILMFLTWIGIGTLIQSTPLLFSIIRYFGAFYLLFLGSKILWSVVTKKKYSNSNDVKPRSMILTRSLILSLTNPKAILFYMSFFVQFIDTRAKNPGASFLILATTLELISFIYMGFLIFLGVFLMRYLQDKKKLVHLGNGLIGILFIGLAARLVTLHS